MCLFLFVGQSIVSMLTLSVLVAIYGVKCTCSTTENLFMKLGHVEMSKELGFLLCLGLFFQVFLICNYFACRITTRFLIKNLVVLHINYVIFKAAGFDFDVVSGVFKFALMILGAATVTQRFLRVKNILFTAFCVTNVFLYAIVLSPRFEMIVLSMQHRMSMLKFFKK